MPGELKIVEGELCNRIELCLILAVNDHVQLE